MTPDECNDKHRFIKAVEELGNYVNKNKMSNPGDLAPIYRDLKVLIIPVPPENMPKNDEGVITALAREVWKQQVKTYTDRLMSLQDNTIAMYSVVWGQCSQNMQAKIKSEKDYEAKSEGTNCVIWLLQTVKSIMYLFEGQTYIFEALSTARHTLESYRQGDGQTVVDFYTNFKSLSDAFWARSTYNIVGNR